MKQNYKKLGDIVNLVDERNSDGKVKNLLCVFKDLGYEIKT